MPTIVVDVDHTLTIHTPGVPYADQPPNLPVIARLREYHARGWKVVVASARGMRTYENDVELINANVLPTLLDWLAKHDVPHDTVVMGKPWCETGGFYVDDRAIRPSEFVNMDVHEIQLLLDREPFHERHPPVIPPR